MISKSTSSFHDPFVLEWASDNGCSKGDDWDSRAQVLMIMSPNATQVYYTGPYMRIGRFRLSSKRSATPKMHLPCKAACSTLVPLCVPLGHPKFLVCFVHSSLAEFKLPALHIQCTPELMNVFASCPMKSMICLSWRWRAIRFIIRQVSVLKIADGVYIARVSTLSSSRVAK